MFMQKPEWAAFHKANRSIEAIDLVLTDICGNAFGKRVPASQFAKLLETGSPICAAMQLVDQMGNTADPMGYGFSDGDPDAMARPLAGTLSMVPWADGRRAQVLCSLTGQDAKAPVWYDPRALLAGVCQRFDELGLTPVIAHELEFYMLEASRTDDGGPVPCRSFVTGLQEGQGQVLSLGKLDEFEPALSRLVDGCRSMGIPVSTIISEYGAGQFEINLDHQSDAVLASDHAVMLRRAIKGIMRQMGMDATFMAKPFADQSGNGLHIHFSLLDKKSRNIFDPKATDGELMLGHAIAGLQATMGEAMAFFAPNINVYRRFKPDEFTPVTRDWGENNRSMAFRLPLAGDGAGRRIEHRVAGADANPYLVAAAVLAGVHHGISNKLVPTPRATGNAGAEIDTSLPLRLWDALAALQAAEILKPYFGADYLQIYHEVKSNEFESFMESPSPAEYAWYL